MFFFLLCIVVSRFRNACAMGDFLCYSIICGSTVQLQCIDSDCFCLLGYLVRDQNVTVEGITGDLLKVLLGVITRISRYQPVCHQKSETKLIVLSHQGPRP